MRLLARALCLAALLLTAGCALTVDTIDVRYEPPPQPAAAVPGAEAVMVAVTARDARTAYRDRVSSKKNGYGMEMAQIVARGDVIAEVQRAVLAEMAARGFRAGGAPDALIEVDVLRFYSDFKVGFWTATADAEVLLNVRVRGAEQPFSATYSGTNSVGGIVVFSGENAAPALNAALRDAVQKMVIDPLFIAAVMAARPTYGRRPGS
ncbi:YajG family lipoprotein [Roseomonas sp. NAR14]|uniref:YajG family lipoprotein n=1 Tax=Roseomonas acroporae TaxID=2937791 RepID=A0A9X1YD78_9PROT|nr:YajG family lipoprotein [Roseomonas acroporae]MCK8787630.1 YajG family lipoprotein [Roseomonas acroporae]